MATAHQQILEEDRFAPLALCWICGGSDLAPVHQGLFDFTEYKEQDPELARYTGARFWLNRCPNCGFAQPDALPTLPNYFDRMYDQRWAEDWIEQEFESEAKDYIFKIVLGELDRHAGDRRRLLDVGAHVGRLMHLAERSGWQAEGIELNPRTSAFAARKTGLPVHRVNAHSLAREAKRYDAVTLLDVLEHIPDPVRLLAGLRELLETRGWIAVKVPCGPAQLLKERIRSRARRGRRVSVADNLVHINHFSVSSLRLALERAGYRSINITVGAPELMSSRPANGLRLGVYHLARCVPGALYSPLALNLQAYAQK